MPNPQPLNRHRVRLFLITLAHVCGCSSCSSRQTRVILLQEVEIYAGWETDMDVGDYRGNQDTENRRRTRRNGKMRDGFQWDF